MLVLSLGVGDHRVLGATLDDSAGEAFDKVARLLLRHVYPTPRQGVPATVADGAAALSGTPPALEALGACADAATAVHGGARVEALASQCGNGPIPHLPTPLRGRPVRVCGVGGLWQGVGGFGRAHRLTHSLTHCCR